MIADLKPYPEYKESGLPWLGQVPTHWEVLRIKSAIRNIIEQTSEMKVDEVYLALEHVESWTGKARPKFDSSLFIGQVKRFRKSDVLFGKLRPYLAKVTSIQRDGVCSGEFMVLRPSNASVISKYLENFMRAKPIIDVINGSTFGAKMPRADWQFCGNLRFLIPPPEEQEAIVRFLDWATGRLDRAIRAKRKIIALLNEKKQVIIQRAVTRGLDPNVPLKPSGIPWLGDIPAHWSLTPNRAFLRIRKVLVGARHGDYKLLSLTKRGVLIRDMTIGGKFSSFWERSQEVRPGDLVFCLFDVEETPRTVGLSKHLGMISGDYTVFECSDSLTASFVESFYIAMDDRKLLSPLYSGLRKRIQKPEFLAVSTPLPPSDEMVAIAKFLEDSLKTIQCLIDNMSHEVNLLFEYRTRLIADVVTGKLDVREAVAKLPNEVIGEVVDELAEEEPETDDPEVET